MRQKGLTNGKTGKLFLFKDRNLQSGLRKLRRSSSTGRSAADDGHIV
jgi:hypothetical protein